MTLKTELERIDHAIVKHRQEIAMRQVEIANLETARLVLLGLGAPQPAEQINGAQPPLLIVRPAGMTEQLTDKKERDRERWRRKEQTQARRDYKREYERRKKAEQQQRTAAADVAPEVRYGGSKPGRRKASPERREERAVMRQRVLTQLEIRTEPVRSGDMIHALGITEQRVKQQVYQCFHELLKAGEVKRGDDYRYTLVRQ